MVQLLIIRVGWASFGHEIDIPDGVLLMLGRHIFLLELERKKLHGEIHLVSIPNRIGLIYNEVLVELVVSVVLQELGDAVTFTIQCDDIQWHSRFQERQGRVLLDEIINGSIVDVVRNVLDGIRSTGLDAIVYGNLVLLHLRVQMNLGSHVAHVLYCFLYLLLRLFGDGSIVDNGLIAYLSQKTIEGTGRVRTRPGIDVHGHLHQVEPFGVGVLANVANERRGVHFLRVRHDVHFIEQVFPFGDELVDGAWSK